MRNIVQNTSLKFSTQHQRLASSYAKHLPSSLPHFNPSNPKFPWKSLALFATAGAAYVVWNELESEAPIHEPILNVNGIEKWTSVVVGGGSAGCVAAYFLAKQMEDHHIPGDVLLIERGDGYETANPHMEGWFDNWGSLGQTHDAVVIVRNKDGEIIETLPYAVVPTEHRGLGGCGAHDTRIFFIPTDEEQERYAKALGIPKEEFSAYLQAALNLEPTISGLPGGDPFFDEVLKTFREKSRFHFPDRNWFVNLEESNNLNGRVKANTAGYVTIGAYEPKPGTTLRWSSAFLLEGKNKPKNLTVLTGVEAEKILFRPDTRRSIFRNILSKWIGEKIPLEASALIVQKNNEKYQISLDPTGHITIAAGALGTPAILQRSGVGDPEVLKKVNIEPIIPSKEVGHGVDHEEIAVIYDLPKSKTSTKIPNCGVIGWPVVIFRQLEKLERLMQAHFSISGPPYTDGAAVVGTPNNTQPDLSAGYRVEIQSSQCSKPLLLKYEESEKDKAVFLAGVREMISLFDVLKQSNLVGERIAPKKSTLKEKGVDLLNDEELWNWISENKGTAYHWLCTCKAGVAGLVESGSVADETFRLRNGTDSPETIHNVFLTSGAALPFPPMANPHVTIHAFAIAQAHKAFQSVCQAQGKNIERSSELRKAYVQVNNYYSTGFTLSSPGTEMPRQQETAEKYGNSWSK